jgi:hypothetical protein
MKPKHVVVDPLFGEIEIEAVPAGVDPLEHLQRTMDDCPECQAARARGEVPQFGMLSPPARKQRFPRPMRWRKRKRG